MKFSSIILASVLGVAAAGKPQLSVSVQDGKFDGLDGLNRKLYKLLLFRFMTVMVGKSLVRILHHFLRLSNVSKLT